MEVLKTEEKLQHFTTVTLENVQRECDQMLTEYKQNMDRYYKQQIEEADKKAKLTTSIAEDGIKRKASQEYTSMQMHLKRKINHKQEEIKDKLFAEVRELLKEYVKPPEYKEYVLSKIEYMKKFAAGDELEVVLEPDDMELVDEIRQTSNLKIIVSDKASLGGVVGRIRHRNILIDESFETKFEDLKETYVVCGGK